MKDILVDNTVAKNFCNPLDPDYKAFIQWIQEKGVLVVTQNLLNEYIGTAGASPSDTSMPALVDRLTRDGRLTYFKNTQLSGFRFPAKISKRLLSNKKDHRQIKAVLLSYRRFALSHDSNFRLDINGYPGYNARAEIRPTDIPYK